MTIKEIIENYLTERFNYNPNIDIKDDSDAKNNLHDLEYSIHHYTNKNFNKTILKKLDYKFLIPSLIIGDERVSPYVALYEWDFLANINDAEKIFIKLINNLSKEEIRQLKRHKDVGINILQIYYFYFGNFSSVDCDFEVKYIGGEPVSMKLKDPFHSFPELDFMRKVKDMFNLSANTIVNLFKEEIGDYASQSVGEYNSDGREAFLMYYHDFLEKEILSDKKDMDKQIQIDTLTGYKKEIEETHRRIKVLNSCKSIPSELKYTFSSMKNELELKIKEIPARYRNLEIIQKKIQLLLN